MYRVKLALYSIIVIVFTSFSVNARSRRSMVKPPGKKSFVESNVENELENSKIMRASPKYFAGIFDCTNVGDGKFYKHNSNNYNVILTFLQISIVRSFEEQF